MDAARCIPFPGEKRWYAVLEWGDLPYGDELSSIGTGASSYGYTGQWTDLSGLIYLRARYYAPWDGRFMSRDPWGGDYNRPMSYNKWLYGYANPIMFTDPSGMIPIPDVPCDILPPELAKICREYYESCGFGVPPDPPIPPNPTNLCDAQCMYEITTPLRDWRTIHSFSNPERAASVRMLLAEMAWRFLTNQNWEAEATGILWTVKNRVTWEILRNPPNNDKTKDSIFTHCIDGYVDCIFAPGQYATTTSPRGRDPLYLDPDEPGRRRSYYTDEKYIAAIINKAVFVSNKVLGGIPDPTLDRYGDGAHFFSHEPETVFTKMVDFTNGELDPHHEHTLTVPYVEMSPPW